ncbi:MAG: Gfo/Idh/MocA family oxidoreductase [Eubacterium sp.]|jgi:predicted dehydrogenase|nr:Gfo/Idh/MocA family oxidoreductase [Eubacterium sp.]
MNIALIGFGYWGPNIAKNLNRTKKANLYAICDMDENNLKRAQSLYGDSVKYVTDYHELIDKVDAFAIALRQNVSYPIAIELLKQKKHLFMEKPLATSTEQVDVLGKLSEEYGVTLHVDHIMVFHPIIRYIKNMIETGELGDLLYFDVSRMNLGPHIKNDINAMWDLAVHDIAVLDYLCDGMEAKRVSAAGLAHYGKSEELTYLNVEYEGLIASIRSSWISPIKERRMVIAGTKKMVIFDDMQLDEKLTICDKGIEVSDDFNEYGKYEARVRMGNLMMPHIESEDILLNSIEHFIDCINTGKESICSYKQARRVISILEHADADMKG